MTTRTAHGNVASAGLYSVKAGRFDLIDVPEMPFAWVDGEGPPEGPAFQGAIRGLYPIAYGVHFALAHRGQKEKVYPLEGLWWNVDEIEDPGAGPGDEAWTGWRWSALIRLPQGCSAEDAEAARTAAVTRHPEQAEDLARVEYRSWREGLCVQTLYVGPYSAEAATIRALHDFIGVHGYRATGRHHEIYLGDPRRSAPDRLRTIIRQPVDV